MNFQIFRKFLNEKKKKNRKHVIHVSFGYLNTFKVINYR